MFSTGACLPWDERHGKREINAAFLSFILFSHLLDLDLLDLDPKKKIKIENNNIDRGAPHQAAGSPREEDRGRAGEGPGAGSAEEQAR